MTPEEIEAGIRDGSLQVLHTTPAINEECPHEWSDGPEGPEDCVKCGLSFTRFVHCCMP